MTFYALLIGCATGPTIPEGPQLGIAKMAARNLCKIYQGAGLACEVDGTSVTTDAHRINATALYDAYDDTLGVVTFRGTIALAVEDGATWTTRMSGYGSGKEAAMDRGLHEWALISGTAFADALRQDAERATYRAVLPPAEETPHREVYAAGQTAVWPGWTMQRPTLESGPDHTDLVARMAPMMAELGPPPHMVRIEVHRNLESLDFTCYADGVVEPKLCAAIEDYRWPDVGGFELRQSYAVFGAPVPSAPAAAPEAPPADAP